MKKISLALIILCAFQALAFSPIQAKKTSGVDLLSNVTGVVTFSASRSSLSPDMEIIMSGPEGKFQKVRSVKVTGTNTGEYALALQQKPGSDSHALKARSHYEDSEDDDRNSDNGGEYFFSIPLPYDLVSILSTFAYGSKAKAKNLSSVMNVTFSNEGSPSLLNARKKRKAERDGGSVGSVISIQKISASQSFSVLNITGVRRGNSAMVQGTFSSNGARGRFKLNFRP